MTKPKTIASTPHNLITENNVLSNTLANSLQEILDTALLENSNSNIKNDLEDENIPNSSKEASKNEEDTMGGLSLDTGLATGLDTSLKDAVTQPNSDQTILQANNENSHVTTPLQTSTETAEALPFIQKTLNFIILYKYYFLAAGGALLFCLIILVIRCCCSRCRKSQTENDENDVYDPVERVGLKQTVGRRENDKNAETDDDSCAGNSQEQSSVESKTSINMEPLKNIHVHVDSTASTTIDANYENLNLNVAVEPVSINNCHKNTNRNNVTNTKTNTFPGQTLPEDNNVEDEVSPKPKPRFSKGQFRRENDEIGYRSTIK